MKSILVLIAMLISVEGRCQTNLPTTPQRRLTAEEYTAAVELEKIKATQYRIVKGVLVSTNKVVIINGTIDQVLPERGGMTVYPYKYIAVNTDYGPSPQRIEGDTPVFIVGSFPDKSDNQPFKMECVKDGIKTMKRVNGSTGTMEQYQIAERYIPHFPPPQ